MARKDTSQVYYVDRFMEETRHLILNENCSPTSLEHTYVIQKMLNELHAEIFPHLCYSVDEKEVGTLCDYCGVSRYRNTEQVNFSQMCVVSRFLPKRK